MFFAFQVLRGISSADAIAKTIVFCETKRNADALTRSLVCAGWPTGALHGDKEQRERERERDLYVMTMTLTTIPFSVLPRVMCDVCRVTCDTVHSAMLKNAT